MSSNRISSDYHEGSEGTIPRQRLGLLLLIAGPALLALSLFAGTLILELAGLGTFLGGFIVMLQGDDEQLSASTASSLINSQLLLQSLLTKSDDKRVLLGLSSRQGKDDLVIGRLQGDRVVARETVPLGTEDQFMDFRSLILSKLPSRFDNTDQLISYVGEAVQEDLHLASTFGFSSSLGRVTLSLGGFKLRNVCTDENQKIHTSFGCVFCNTVGMIVAEQTHSGVVRLESRYDPSSDTTIISYSLAAPLGADVATGKRLADP